MKFPGSVLASVFLFVAETTAALYLSSTYRSGGDGMWQALTLLFSLLPCALVQLTLLFVHRDFSRDRPLVLLLHLLQLGPLFRCVRAPGSPPPLPWPRGAAFREGRAAGLGAGPRAARPARRPHRSSRVRECDRIRGECFEVFCIYCQSGHIEEPYVSITKKRQMPKNGFSEEVEKEVGQAEGKLFTHRSAFSRASVIQAFLGSAPQLTLQLYISTLQQDVTIGRFLGSFHVTGTQQETREEQASLIYAQHWGLDEAVGFGTRASPLLGLGHGFHPSVGVILKEVAQVLVVAQGPVHVLWGDAHLVVVVGLLACQLQDVGRQAGRWWLQRRRKSRWSRSTPGSSLLGKVESTCWGYKQTLKMIRHGKAKLVILANNCPALRRSEIEYYAMLAKTGVHHYSGNNIELGTACGKYYRIRTLAVIDPVKDGFLDAADLGIFVHSRNRAKIEGAAATCEEKDGLFMVLSLLSIVYGALRCNILAIKIKYDEYDVKVKPLAYVCIFLWRSFEIATRVIVLVLFTSVLKAWVVIVVLINFFSFFLYPWILFWCSGSPFPENIEKALSRVGTTIVLCFLTLLYAGINMFCWSAVQLKINNPDLISKSQNWYRLLVYYMLRFIENAFLLLMWYLYKTDIYMYVCAPLLILQLLIGYCTAILFMLVFYQFFHPCKKLFSSSVSEGFQEWLKCVCCDCRQQKSRESVGKTDLRSTGDRDETPSSSKISSMPSQILNTDELCSA
ncbi:hypothetical protein GH733_019086 [Mirounga leonina]|nr:hypothetical protein GH733_019086 [Mirounga leonina]